MLNRCVTQVEKGLSRQLSIQGEDTIDYSSVDSDHPEDSSCPEVYYNYAYLEDITVQQDANGQVQRQQSFMHDETDGPIIQEDSESASPLTHQSSDNHVLKWMVCFC